MQTSIKDLYRLNRYSDVSVILQYSEIIFDAAPFEDVDFNEFGGESAHSFLGVDAQ